MVKKYYISIFTFLVLFVVVFFYLNKVFITQNKFVNSYEDYLSLAKKTNIDVVFYGNSLSYRVYNPLIINNKCKTISYNLGSSGFNMSLTDILLKESLKHNKPKLIVLSSDDGAYKKLKDKKRKGFQLHAIDYIPNYTINKLKKITSVYDKNEYLGVLSPLLRNHKKWYNKKYFNLSRRKNHKGSKKENFYHSGYLAYFDEINDEKITKHFNSFIKTEKKEYVYGNAMTNKQIKHLSNFITIANKNDIDVLVLTAPMLNAIYADNKFYSSLEKVCDSLNVKYLNINKHYKELKYNLTDFQDVIHVNNSGSIKASNFLANYINDNYDLPTKIKNKEWKLLNKQFIEFNKFVDQSKNPITFNYKQEFNFTKTIQIDSVKVKQEYKKLAFELYLNKNLLEKDDLNKYNLSINIYPKENGLVNLNKRSKDKKRNYDKKDVAFDKNIIKVKMQTKIKNLKKIKLFLYDRAGYSGITSKMIIIDNINFK
jgi:hypothetical protein